MVSVRLSRMGAKNQPKYRIVAIDSHKKRDGRYIEELGFYDPTVNPSVVRLNEQRYSYWLSVGAQPSQTVVSLSRKLFKPAPKEGEVKKAVKTRTKKTDILSKQ